MGNTTIFDDVLRTIQERRPELLIPLINESISYFVSIGHKGEPVG